MQPSKTLKKELDIKIDSLFNEMLDYIKKNGVDKQLSHRSPKTNKLRYFSNSILKFRGKALEIAKSNMKKWEISGVNYFLQGFGRKTTPYLWFKKELPIKK